jgi:predicted phage gp36 major capsid-like protein
MDRETVDEIKRHFGVIQEQVRSDVKGVAEGQQALRAEMQREFSAVRSELAHESQETRALIRLSYGELDRRVKSLESDMADCRTRLERLEGRFGS